MSRKSFLRIIVAGLLSLLPALAAANQIRVDTTLPVDPDKCTITSAILAAEGDSPVAGCAAGSGPDVIKIPAGIYTIYEPHELDFYGNSTAFPYIDTDITIEGEPFNNSTTCRGDGNPRARACDAVIERYTGSFFDFRFFTVRGWQFTIRNVVLEGGQIGYYEGGGAILASTFTLNQMRVAITIENVHFKGNYGASGGAVADTGYYFGPFVDFTVRGSRFTNNRASSHGGGIYVQPGSSLTVTASLFEDNDGGEWGGGVATRNAETALFDISDTIFRRNTAEQAGGAVYNTSPRLTRVTMDGNWVRDTGGALYAYGGRPVIKDSTFKGNRARRGGAIQVIEGGIEIDGSTFTANVSTDFEAGVLYLDDRARTSRIVNSTISGNSTASAGAITLINGALRIDNSTIVFNTNTPGGGSVALYPGNNGSNEITLSNSIVAGNSMNGVQQDFYVDPNSGDRIVSGGHNIIGTNWFVESVFTAAGDVTGTPAQALDPGLLPLSDNGGLTHTHALAPASVARDAGSTAEPGTAGACEAVDQRGTSRPGPPSTVCDAGAFEDAVYFTLTVRIDGNGFGAVTVPSIIDNCNSGVCTAVVGSGTPLRFTAHRGGTSDFIGWSGACSGTSITCDITMDGDRNVSATFATWGGATTTTLAISPSPADVGEPVTLSAKVVAAPAGRGVPSGNVRFVDLTFPGQAIEAAIGPNGNAEFTTQALAPGTHTFQAIYLGNALFSPSSGFAEVRIGLSPNIRPTFALQPDPPTVGRSSGPQVVPGFAFLMTATEANQSLLGFAVTPGVSIGTLTFSAPPHIGLDGTLSYAATDGTVGIATFSATLRDDGGTENGGQDTSVPRVFTITVNGPPPMLFLRLTETIGVQDESLDFTLLNTSPGADVMVEPADDVEMTFEAVDEAGTTTAAAIADAPPPPPGFDFTSPPVAYDIHTTSVFHGPVRVCMNHPPATISPRLMHFENGAWVDTTVSRNGESSIVCGSVTALSPFAVMTPVFARGRMAGHGAVGDDDEFDFRIDERSFGRERGHVKFTHVTPKSGRQKKQTDRFESTQIDNIAFWDDPAYRPARRGHVAVDSVVFAGLGTWNGVLGYRFEVEASDQGEKGKGHDRFRIVVRAPDGSVVGAADGVLTRGNIQSQRVKP